MQSRGLKFRQAVAENPPLQIVGAVNAYSAILAKNLGHRAVYLSGGGVAACSLGIPDLGITTLADVLVDARRITDVCDLPLLVDIDTGWGGAFNIARAIRELERAEVAAIHMEDQQQQKRCGHRPNKAIVSADEMEDRIKAAVDARTDPNFVIMARTDALQQESLNSAIERTQRYIEAGADMIFPEAVATLEEYRAFKQALQKPILANITEFGKTPLFEKSELHSAGVDMVLYPLSAFRAMSKAAIGVYSEILEKGTQKHLTDQMQTREELYQQIDYHRFEQIMDSFQQKQEKS